MKLTTKQLRNIIKTTISEAGSEEDWQNPEATVERERAGQESQLSEISGVLVQLIADVVDDNLDGLIEDVEMSIDNDNVLLPARYEDVDSFSSELAEQIKTGLDHHLKSLARRVLERLMEPPAGV